MLLIAARPAFGEPVVDVAFFTPAEAVGAPGGDGVARYIGQTYRHGRAVSPFAIAVAGHPRNDVGEIVAGPAGLGGHGADLN